MKEYTLTNEVLKLSISEEGAELCNIQSVHTGREYLWCGDSLFWGRHSPVLFPLVGKVWQGAYKVNGKIFNLPQHGFARDSIFKLALKQSNEIWFSLESSPQTLEKYPFLFQLKLGYRLSGNKIEVLWEVYNTAENDLFFQIGAHPAFYYWEMKDNCDLRAYLDFHTSKELISTSISSDGYLLPNQKYPLDSVNGKVEISEHTLFGNTWILENNQIQQVSLLDANKEPYLRMNFDAPVLGIWSPKKANCPFICIEPWYGVCDPDGYQGEFNSKHYINTLQPNNVFKTSYSIEILK